VVSELLRVVNIHAGEIPAFQSRRNKNVGYKH
jgi:hypothetical protein